MPGVADKAGRTLKLLARRGIAPLQPATSIHVKRRIFPEYVGGGDQGMFRHRPKEIGCSAVRRASRRALRALLSMR